MDGGESQILGLDAGGRFAVSEKRRGLVLVNRSVADVVANERYFFVVFSGVFCGGRVVARWPELRDGWYCACVLYQNPSLDHVESRSAKARLFMAMGSKVVGWLD